MEKKERKKKPVNYDTKILIMVSMSEKEKLQELAHYYRAKNVSGMSAMVRHMINTLYDHHFKA